MAVFLRELSISIILSTTHQSNNWIVLQHKNKFKIENGMSGVKCVLNTSSSSVWWIQSAVTASVQYVRYVQAIIIKLSFDGMEGLQLGLEKCLWFFSLPITVMDRLTHWNKVKLLESRSAHLYIMAMEFIHQLGNHDSSVHDSFRFLLCLEEGLLFGAFSQFKSEQVVNIRQKCVHIY